MIDVGRAYDYVTVYLSRKREGGEWRAVVESDDLDGYDAAEYGPDMDAKGVLSLVAEDLDDEGSGDAV